MRSLCTSTLFLGAFLGATSNVPAQADWAKHIIQEPARGGINGVSASDFNQDGHVDVISSLEGRVVVYQGPDWTPHTVHRFSAADSHRKPGPACIHSCLMDADGDGDQDFIGSNQTVFWLECPDDPFNGQPWTFRTIDDEIAGTHCVLPGDVNRDGKLDLIANSGRDEKATPFPNSITWLEVPGDPHAAPNWTRHVFADKDAPGGSHYMGFGDVNGDGRPDIACAAKGTDGFENGQWFAWWEQPKDATVPWTKHLLAENEVGASNLMPADFDGDGHMDYFATRGHGQGVLLFRGPAFEKVEIDPDIQFPHSLDLGDIDGDGDTDAVTCGKEADGVAAWYQNNGNGGFTKHVIGI
ncbi:MAG: VCBS repeat-containing protein, partial [Verrucomicrobiae bacterium]|nr:VCBS repeat-containing protein [Verrucomicrobiae bacterium]